MATALDRKSILTVPALEFKADGEAGTIEGYGSTFGNLDRVRDVVRQGAFKASLSAFKKRKEMPGFFWMHDPAEPIGEWLEMEEDEKGLRVKGRLFIGPDRRTEASTKAWNLSTSNGPKGFSIGFYPGKWKMDQDKDGMPFRDLKTVDLVEVSFAPYVINEQARVTSAKALTASLLRDESGKCLTIRDAEAMVRDALGLSRSDAKALLAGGYAALAGMRSEDEPRRDAGDDPLAAFVAAARGAGLAP
jgi:HK97 family phage prohead protease